MPKGDYCKISKQDLIDDVLKIYNENKENFNRELYISKGKYSRAPIIRIFKTWNNMLKELNIKLNVSRMEASKEDVLLDAKKVIDKFGKLNSTIYRKHGKYSQCITDRLFGNFNNMLRELNLNSAHASRYLSDKEVINEIHDIFKKYKRLTLNILNEECSISFPSIIKRFDTISNLYTLLGVTPDENDTPLYYTANLVIKKISDILNEDPIYEWTSFDLKNPITNSNLYFDAYFPEHNLLFEYNGEQHYKYVDFFEKDEISFKNRQYRDNIKVQYCKDRNINLLIIKYDDDWSDENLESLLEQYVTQK